MGVALIRRLEPLNADERAFLKRRETRERHQLYKAVRIMMPFCFVLPFAVAWGEAIIGRENPFSALRYFAGVGILCGLVFVSAYLGYRSSLRLVRLDLIKGTKTIEQVRITGKRFMPHDNTCHLYLESSIRLSIEVSAGDFERVRIGDFLNIEYSTRAKAYLGYS